jgi:hypothetical protein
MRYLDIDDYLGEEEVGCMRGMKNGLMTVYSREIMKGIRKVEAYIHDKLGIPDNNASFGKFMWSPV